MASDLALERRDLNILVVGFQAAVFLLLLREEVFPEELELELELETGAGAGG